jgi:hypothetical protein
MVRPLIDRGGLLWFVPCIIMAMGLFVGGTIAGYRRQGLNVALHRLGLRW